MFCTGKFRRSISRRGVVTEWKRREWHVQECGTDARDCGYSARADATWQHGSTDGEIFTVIRDGIGPDFAMDSFDGPLSAEEIWDLVNYLKSLGGSR